MWRLGVSKHPLIPPHAELTVAPAEDSSDMCPSEAPSLSGGCRSGPYVFSFPTAKGDLLLLYIFTFRSIKNGNYFDAGLPDFKGK